MGDNDAVLNELVVCVELKIDYEIHFEILLQLHCFSPQLSCLKREPDLENSMKHETWLCENRLDASQQVHLPEYFKDIRAFDTIIIFTLYFKLISFSCGRKNVMPFRNVIY